MKKAPECAIKCHGYAADFCCGEFCERLAMKSKLAQVRKLPKLPPLDAVADKVLSYKPMPKSKPARRRKRRAKKLAQVPDA